MTLVDIPDCPSKHRTHLRILRWSPDLESVHESAVQSFSIISEFFYDEVGYHCFLMLLSEKVLVLLIGIIERYWSFKRER